MFNRGNPYLLLPACGKPLLQSRAGAVRLVSALFGRDVGSCSLVCCEHWISVTVFKAFRLPRVLWLSETEDSFLVFPTVRN